METRLTAGQVIALLYPAGVGPTTGTAASQTPTMTSTKEDARWKHMVAGIDAYGNPIPMTAERLAAVTSAWPTSSATPPGVSALLRTSRSLWALAWYDYELLAVAASWSLIAVEAAFRERLHAHTGARLASLIKNAVEADLISLEWSERLDAGRRLRNSLAHARQQNIWPLGTSEPVIRTSHEVIAVLFPEP